MTRAEAGQAAGTRITGLVSVLILSIGCRTPQPVLKPEKAPEVLRTAPQEARYESSTYPKAAFSPTEDPSKRFSADAKGLPKGGMAPGAGGIGGMSGRGY